MGERCFFYVDGGGEHFMRVCLLCHCAIMAATEAPGAPPTTHRAIAADLHRSFKEAAANYREHLARNGRTHSAYKPSDWLALKF